MQLGQDLRRLGPRPSARRIQPSGPDCGRQGHRRADGRLGLAELGVELGLAEARLVDVAVAAQVILDRVDPAQRPLAGDGAVVVGDRHVDAAGRGRGGRSPCPGRARPRSPRAAAIRST